MALLTQIARAAGAQYATTQKSIYLYSYEKSKCLKNIAGQCPRQLGYHSIIIASGGRDVMFVSDNHLVMTLVE